MEEGAPEPQSVVSFFAADPNLGKIFELVNARLAPQSLQLHDASWVDRLMPDGSECDPESLRMLNLCVARDASLRTREGRDPERKGQALEARRTFFADILGWEHQNHPLAKTYGQFENEKPTLTPLQPFIDAQRVLHEAGINGREVLARSCDAVSTSAERYRRIIKEMRRFALPLQLIERAPHPFIAPQSIGDRIRRLKQVGKSLEWQTDITDFVRSHPTALTCSPKKIALHALLFAKSSQRDLLPREVHGQLIQPIDMHIRSVLKEKNPDSTVTQPISELLQTAWAKRMLGKRIIDAYTAYKVAPKQ